jgi:hypothetical protein
MRKRIIDNDIPPASSADHDWLDLERLAQVEVTSEQPEAPIEAALIPIAGVGWRAGRAGKQTIRLLFDQPRRVTRIYLAFQEHERERTQEFSLRWSPDGGASYHDIARQQYNFSPPTTTREIENYAIDLAAVTILELCIIPDISQGDAVASLQALRLA